MHIKQPLTVNDDCVMIVKSQLINFFSSHLMRFANQKLRKLRTSANNLMAEISHFDEDGTIHENKASETTDVSCRDEPTKGVGRVPYYELFSFADSTDYALMVIGVITSIGSGLCFPLMTILFGELANSFGQNVGTGRVVDEVSKVRRIHIRISRLEREITNQ